MYIYHAQMKKMKKLDKKRKKKERKKNDLPLGAPAHRRLSGPRIAPFHTHLTALLINFIRILAENIQTFVVNESRVG